jgi:membrane dipeptidase
MRRRYGSPAMAIVGLDHVQVAAPPGCEADARRFYGAVLDLPELPKPEALAARGGVFGVMALVLTVGSDAPTLERFVDHVEHAVEVMGLEHVGLGADFIDQVTEAELAAGRELEDATREAMRLGGGKLAIRELQGPADYPRLLDALHRRGFGDDDVAALAGGNWLRLLRGTLPA